MIPTFEFDKRSQRYRYTSGKNSGQFVSREKVLDLMEAKISLIKEDLSLVTELLLQNRISLGTWEQTVASAIKTQHILGYSVGKGGIDRLNQSDYGRIGQYLRGQYVYLRRFSESIARGNLTPNQIRDRLTKYADAVYTSYELGVRESHRLAGYRWERRITAGSGQICGDCSDYASRGWSPIGLLPPPGVGSACLSRCRCIMDYSQEVSRPNTDILSLKLGWLQTSLTA